MRLPTFLLLAAFCSISTTSALADIVPGTVSDDVFDSSCGTIVLDHDTIVDPINAFTTSGGFEDGHVLMRNGGPGSVSFIKFQTSRAVTIQGVRLFAQDPMYSRDDGPSGETHPPQRAYSLLGSAWSGPFGLGPWIGGPQGGTHSTYSKYACGPRSYVRPLGQASLATPAHPFMNKAG